MAVSTTNFLRKMKDSQNGNSQVGTCANFERPENNWRVATCLKQTNFEGK